MHRLTALAGAIAVVGATAIGASTGTAQAAPGCPDIHWIGAAGSGERDGNPAVNGGMGRVVYESLRDVAQLAYRDGHTITAEAVQYPAVSVPTTGSLLGWAGFLGSLHTGTWALGEQYASFVQRCPDTKVVLAGYSQGAMVVHRNLPALADSPNLAGALLIADGDRLPNDTTIDMGTAASVPGAGKGVAQEWPILASAPTAPLPPSVGARTISVCDLDDPVCDHDPAASVTPAAVAIHTSYVAARSGGSYSWTRTLYQLLRTSPAAVQLAAAES